jgi:hypothetical protein
LTANRQSFSTQSAPKIAGPRSPATNFHRIFQIVLSDATAWLMGRYVIMPDHIHFFAADVDSEIPYENWVTYIKSQMTKQFRAYLRETTPGGRDDDMRGRGAAGRGGELGGRGSRRAVSSRRAADTRQASASTTPDPDFRWQTDHWDTRMRDFQSYEEKWIYMLDNPVRAGLVTHAEDLALSRRNLPTTLGLKK